MTYLRGPWNKFDDKEQWIRISDGCPNQCEFCLSPPTLEFYGIPNIIRRDVKIMDMNLLQQPNALEVIKDLGSKRVEGKVIKYQLVCGIDWRVLTNELAVALREARFVKIRLAWDYSLKHQYKIKDAIKILVKAGYRREDLTVFMICNWRIPYQECCKKLDICKVWNVKVADCWFDNQIFPNPRKGSLQNQCQVKPKYWSPEEIIDFRRRVRRHNLLVLFKIDPAVK